MAAAVHGAASGVGIVGGGLAGALLALALRERATAVWLIDHGAPSATAASYGVVPGWPLEPSPLGRLAAGAGRRWRELQQRHGDLGWRRRWPLPLSQVDTARLKQRLGPVLQAAGVQVVQGKVAGLEAASSGWRLELAGGGALQVGQLVLAAGAGCQAMHGDIPAVLGVSWAGVLQLPPLPDGAAYPLRLPSRFQRLTLEARSAELGQAEWVVDAGLVPWGEGGLLGQLSWISPGGAAAGGEPDPRRAEGWLRESLAAAPSPLAALAAASGSYLQVPVAFCRDGPPLAGPLAAAAGAQGLWLFSGFRGGFAQVPVLAPLLAAAIAGDPRESSEALAGLARCGVRPDLRGRG
jgi:glycine/D-amino acid oxidase-like deaminating enzyme